MPSILITLTCAEMIKITIPNTINMTCSNLNNEQAVFVYFVAYEQVVNIKT